MSSAAVMSVIQQTNFPGIVPSARGKVRDIYDLGDKLLLVATDRLSAFDVVLPTPIPDKGAVLTQLSLFWFDLLNKLFVIRSTVKPREKSTGQEQPRLAEAAMNVRMVAPPVAEPPVSAMSPPPVISSFQSHEWANEADSRGGVL